MIIQVALIFLKYKYTHTTNTYCYRIGLHNSTKQTHLINTCIYCTWQENVTIWLTTAKERKPATVSAGFKAYLASSPGTSFENDVGGALRIAR